MIFDELTAQWSAFSGETAYYFTDLTDNEEHSFAPEHSFDAASVIKLPVMAAVFDAVKNGEVSLSRLLTVQEKEKVPSCGTVKYLPEGTQVPVDTLIRMMITVSDNTATNMLIRLLSIERINAFLAANSIRTTRLNRLIFDSEAASRGISNRIALSEIAELLKRLYAGTLVDEQASQSMLEILKAQQINHKIPNALPRVPIAHKTGEDSNESHDVAIVYAEHPYILCFASEHTPVYPYECALREASRKIYAYMQEKYRT